MALLLLSTLLVAAPDFRLKSLDGRDVSLRQHRGRIVLLNFWATWCPPCRTEMPWLMELQTRYAAELVVLGVAMDEDGRQAVAPWVERERFAIGGRPQSIAFPVLIGTAAVADAYAVDSLPATFLVGRDGTVVRRIDGPFELADLERDVRRLLATRGPAWVRHRHGRER